MAMASFGIPRLLCWVLACTSVVALLNEKTIGSHSGTGSVIPAETRPCVDCQAFKFMQRALQDIKRAAYNLDSQADTLLLRAEQRRLCDCPLVTAENPRGRTF